MIRGRPPRSPAARSSRPQRGGSSTRPGASRPTGERPRTAPRPRLPVHPLRTGAVRGPRDPGGHADHLGRPAAAAFRHAGRARRGPARPAMGRSAQALLGSLDQGLELSAGNDELRLAGQPRAARLGGRLRPDRSAGAVSSPRPSTSSRSCRRRHDRARARRGRSGAGSASGSSRRSFSRVRPRSGSGRTAPRGRRPGVAPAPTGPSSPCLARRVRARGWLVAASGSRRGAVSREEELAGPDGRPPRARGALAARRRDEPVRAPLPAAGAARVALAPAGPDRPLALRLAGFAVGLRRAGARRSFAARLGLGLDAPWYLPARRRGLRAVPSLS